MPYSLCIKCLLKLITTAWCCLPQNNLEGQDKRVTGEALMKVNSFTVKSALWRMDPMHFELEIIFNTEKVIFVIKKGDMEMVSDVICCCFC